MISYEFGNSCKTFFEHLTKNALEHMARAESTAII